MTDVEDLRELAFEVRSNFMRGYTEYDGNLAAWRDEDGTFIIVYRRRQYETKVLFKAVQLVCRIIRGL
jgi:hypothetical protein